MSEFKEYGGLNVPLEKVVSIFKKIQYSWEGEEEYGCESMVDTDQEDVINCDGLSCRGCILKDTNRDTFLEYMGDNQSQTNKSKGEGKMEKSISVAFAKNTVTEGNLVEKHFGGGRNKDFIDGLVMKKYNKEILAEAERLEDEAKD